MKINVTLNLFIPSVEVMEKNLNLDVDKNSTISDLIDMVDKINFGFKNAIMENENEISKQFLFFINGNNIAHRDGLETVLHSNDEVNVISAIAGG
jgi:molybdopterin converting factor small subunit